MNGVSHSRSSSQTSAFKDASPNAPNPERDAGSTDKPVGIAAQDYAKRVTKLIQLITDLRASGLVYLNISEDRLAHSPSS